MTPSMIQIHPCNRSDTREDSLIKRSRQDLTQEKSPTTLPTLGPPPSSPPRSPPCPRATPWRCTLRRRTPPCRRSPSTVGGMYKLGIQFTHSLKAPGFIQPSNLRNEENPVSKFAAFHKFNLYCYTTSTPPTPSCRCRSRPAPLAPPTLRISPTVTAAASTAEAEAEAEAGAWAGAEGGRLWLLCTARRRRCFSRRCRRWPAAAVAAGTAVTAVTAAAVTAVAVTAVAAAVSVTVVSSPATTTGRPAPRTRGPDGMTEAEAEVAAGQDLRRRAKERAEPPLPPLPPPRWGSAG
jgi:hypothetical protein